MRQAKVGPTTPPRTPCSAMAPTNRSISSTCNKMRVLNNGKFFYKQAQFQAKISYRALIVDIFLLGCKLSVNEAEVNISLSMKVCLKLSFLEAQ